MTEPYQSNTTLPQIAQRIAQANRVLITTHAKPDGDALGSIIALGKAMESCGKTVEYRVMPVLPGNLSFLSDKIEVVVHEGAAAQSITEPDLVIVTDTGAWSQLEPMHAWLADRHDKTIVIDHHLHGDDVASLTYINARAASVCEIVSELIEEMGVSFDPLMAKALFVGIASDTGWFRFSNTRPATHRLAARLIEMGVDHAAIHAMAEQAERPEKLALLVRALDNMQLIAGGHAAVMTLRESDFVETGARYEETERFVDVPQMTKSVQVVALIVENHGHKTRISFRSKPGEDAVDVNQLARQFGGGGHARAAGAKIEADLDEIKPKIVSAIEQLLVG